MDVDGVAHVEDVLVAASRSHTILADELFCPSGNVYPPRQTCGSLASLFRIMQGADSLAYSRSIRNLPKVPSGLPYRFYGNVESTVVVRLTLTTSYGTPFSSRHQAC